MAAGYTVCMDPEGREHLLVAVKGTFSLPLDGRQPQLLDDQVPLMEADVFTGEPGFSAPLYEMDYALHKARCDVLLNGSAYAPNEQPTTKVTVGLNIEALEKTFNVIGDGHWESPTLSIGRSPPKAFLKMPITYDRAFGGIDDFHPDESKHSAYRLNPVGKGYHEHLDSGLVDGTPVPNTEEINNSIDMPRGKYRPMSFGPIGRSWSSRIQYAGTYDQDWIDNISPFLPPDFDEAYYQAAPPDQQISYLKGGEYVYLTNLTPGGKCHFRIPDIKMPVVFFLKKGGKEETSAVIDTLVIEPDLQRFMVTWRVNRPLRKDIFEVTQVLVGNTGKERWRQSMEDVFPKSSDTFPHQVV